MSVQINLSKQDRQMPALIKPLMSSSHPVLKRSPGTLSTRVIELALDVHWELGPGLPLAAYKRCLCYEFDKQNIPYQADKVIPVEYKDLSFDCGYKADLIVNRFLILELRSVDELSGLHELELKMLLKLSELPQGLLINFNTRYLSTGIRRIALTEC